MVVGIMPQHQYTKEDEQFILENYATLGGQGVADFFTDKYNHPFTRKTINKKAKRIRDANRGYEVPELPSQDLTAQELIKRNKAKFERKHAAKEARKLIPIKIKTEGAIGIAHFGDPHVDDDGTNIGLIEEHVALINKTEGLFAGNVGDITNNWIGRLARLYAQQTTTAAEAWLLAEWLLNACPWLYIIGGNHDMWSGAGDPLKWIAAQGGQPYEPHGVRLELQFPNGKKVRINARHDFKGHSMWNTAHGVSKAAQMGWRDHILTCGHTHVSGYQVLKDPSTGLISHAIRTASYKVYDSYAEEKGLPDQNIFMCPVTIIRPEFEDDDPRLITTFFEPYTAAEFLTWVRTKNKN